MNGRGPWVELRCGAVAIGYACLPPLFRWRCFNSHNPTLCPHPARRAGRANVLDPEILQTLRGASDFRRAEMSFCWPSLHSQAQMDGDDLPFRVRANHYRRDTLQDDSLKLISGR